MISGIWDGLDWLCLDGKSQWTIVIRWLTYGLGKVVNFVISRVVIT
jgi:hypothetical protein